MSGSELFESYEHDFNQVSASIGDKINKTIPSQAGGKFWKTKIKTLFEAIYIVLWFNIEKRKATTRAAEREIEEAEEIVR